MKEILNELRRHMIGLKTHFEGLTKALNKLIALFEKENTKELSKLIALLEKEDKETSSK